MTQAKFVSDEPKSGMSAEEMEGLDAKIEAVLNRANELNSDNLEIKARMALKNKLISPQQEQELFEIVDKSDSLYNRYNKGERTEDLLECFEKHCQVLEQKRNEIFPDAPKDAKLKLAKEEKSEIVGAGKEKPANERQPLKIKPAEPAGKEVGKDAPAELSAKEKETELKIDENLIVARAAEIKQRRINNEKGFEWTKIDDLLRQKGLEPGTPEADNFMAKWDRNTAESELRKEKVEKDREDARNKAEETSEKKDFLKIKPSGEPEAKKKLVTEEIATEHLAETEEEREKNLARLGAEITLSRINDYNELWAETEQRGDEKFKEKTRELWKQFAVHGKVLKDKESGKLKVMKFTDLDGNASLGLLELAGIDTKNLEHKEPGKYTKGKINLDTGERHGVVIEDGGKTVFIDHHSDESGKDSSATRFTYDLLVSLGLLERQEYLDKLVEFVTQADNKTYPNEERYFKNYSRNLFGLKDHIKFKHLVEFFKDGHQPHEVLQEKELKKMNLLQASKQKKSMVEKSLAELEAMKENGLIVKTPRYGQIAVDLNRKIPFGFDAIRHAGYQTYLSWSPADKSFFISSVLPITDYFAQGKNIRGTMWIKPPIDETPLTVTLKDILMKMTDGQFQPTGELAEFLAKESQPEAGEKKMELAPEKMEIFKKFGQQFYDALKAGADWDGYDEKNKHTTLDIQTKVFLRKQLKKLFPEDDKMLKIAESLVERINK